jgi:hypothetical protein
MAIANDDANFGRKWPALQREIDMLMRLLAREFCHKPGLGRQRSAPGLRRSRSAGGHAGERVNWSIVFATFNGNGPGASIFRAHREREIGPDLRPWIRDQGKPRPA